MIIATRYVATQSAGYPLPPGFTSLNVFSITDSSGGDLLTANGPTENIQSSQTVNDVASVHHVFVPPSRNTERSFARSSLVRDARTASKREERSRNFPFPETIKRSTRLDPFRESNEQVQRTVVSLGGTCVVLPREPSPKRIQDGRLYPGKHRERDLPRFGGTGGHRGRTVLFVEFAVVTSCEVPRTYGFRGVNAVSSLEKFERGLPGHCRTLAVPLFPASKLGTVTGPYMIRPRG